MKPIRLTTIGKIVWAILLIILIVVLWGIISLFKTEEPKKVDSPAEIDSKKIIDYTDSNFYEYNFDEDNFENSTDDLITIKDSGTYKLTGNNSKYRFKIDSPDSVIKLVFSSFNATVPENLINVVNANKLIIELESGTENTIISSSENATNYSIISSVSDIDFIESGSLKVTSDGEFLNTKANINFKDSILELNNVNNGFDINGNFKMESGTIYVFAAEQGLNSKGNITIESGTFIARSKSAIKNSGLFIINKGKIFLASLEEIQKPNANSLQKTLILNFKEPRNNLLFIHDTTKVVLVYAGELSYQHILYSDEFKAENYVLYGSGKVAGTQEYGLYHVDDTAEDGQLTCEGLENDRFQVKDLVNIYNDIVKK